MLVYVKCECFVMQMLYVCILVCIMWQCCVLHDLQFVNAGRVCKRRPYRRGKLLWMCVLYVNCGSNVRRRTFGCAAMGSAVLCILRSILLIYSAGSDVNRVQIVLSGFSSFVLSRKKLYVGMVVYIFWLHSCLCVWM